MNEEEFINYLVTESVSTGITVFNPYVYLEVSRSQGTKDGWLLYCRIRPKQNLYLTDNNQLLRADHQYYCEVASEFSESFLITPKYVHSLKYIKELDK